MTGIWWLVAHSSGQGWVQAVGELVFGGLVVGVAGPALVVRRAHVRVVSAPTDAVTGQVAELVLHRSAALRVAASLPGDRPSPGVGADRVTVEPTRRGVHHRVTLEVASAAPFGLQWWAKRLQVDLPQPMYVAPAAAPPTGAERPPGPSPAGDASGGRRPSGRSGRGELRSVRPYEPGDARNLVHWPATAHTGRLMVRELETPPASPAELTVVLPGGEEEAEAAAGVALRRLLDLLDAGRPVRLRTYEADGPRVGWVTDVRTARRRLAAAETGTTRRDRPAQTPDAADAAQAPDATRDPDAARAPDATRDPGTPRAPDAARDPGTPEDPGTSRPSRQAP